MFRVLWHIIPDEKVIWVWLTKVYGVGYSRSEKILEKLWIPPQKKVKDLDDSERKAINDELKNYVLENDLRREVRSCIKRLKEIKCYRGMRHNLWLPVRGQKTRHNAKTAKKLLWRSKVRPIRKK